MNREQMVEKAARAMLADDIAAGYASDGWDEGADRNWLLGNARAVLDAVLPQVSTVAELEALHLPAQSVLVDTGGMALIAELVEEFDFRHGPLTVVWQPEVTA